MIKTKIWLEHTDSFYIYFFNFSVSAAVSWSNYLILISHASLLCFSRSPAARRFYVSLPASSAAARWFPSRTSVGLWCSPSPSAGAPRWPSTSSPASSAPGLLCPSRRSGSNRRTGSSPVVWAGMTGASSLERWGKENVFDQCLVSRLPLSHPDPWDTSFKHDVMFFDEVPLMNLLISAH